MASDDLGGAAVQRPRTFWWASVLGAVLVAQAALAADEAGNFAIKGGGLQTCGNFLRAWEENSSDLALYGGWIEGYITGLNQHVSETFDLAPWPSTESLLGLVKLACDAAEPETRFIGAVNDVIRLLLPSRLRSESPAEAVSRNGRTVVVYGEVIRRLEERLSELGYSTGQADQTLDEDTLAALESFQRDRGLTVTGLPDQDTLVALFLR